MTQNADLRPRLFRWKEEFLNVNKSGLHKCRQADTPTLKISGKKSETMKRHRGVEQKHGHQTIAKVVKLDKDKRGEYKVKQEIITDSAQTKSKGQKGHFRVPYRDKP